MLFTSPGEYLLQLTNRSGEETEKFFAENPERHRLGAAQGFAFGWLLGATDQYAKFARPIPVTERLPEDGDDVFVYIVFASDGFGDWGVGSQVFGDWRIWGQCCQEREGYEDEKRTVTHWLPLPPKPE